MFIAIEAARRANSVRSSMSLRTLLHFTPDGASRTRAVIAINIALLTEGETTDHRLQSSDPFTKGPTFNHTRVQTETISSSEFCYYGYARDLELVDIHERINRLFQRDRPADEPFGRQFSCLNHRE